VECRETSGLTFHFPLVPLPFICSSSFHAPTLPQIGPSNRVMGSAVSSPSRVRGGAPRPNTHFCVFSLKDTQKSDKECFKIVLFGLDFSGCGALIESVFWSAAAPTATGKSCYRMSRAEAMLFLRGLIRNEEEHQ